MRTTALLNREILDRFKEVGSQDETPLKEKRVIVKYFLPDANWTFYVLEYNEKYQEFFGYVTFLENEFGYVTMQQVLDMRGKLGLRVERDEFFEEQLLIEAVPSLKK